MTVIWANVVYETILEVVKTITFEIRAVLMKSTDFEEAEDPINITSGIEGYLLFGNYMRRACPTIHFQ